jgi:hypothetical protein
MIDVKLLRGCFIAALLAGTSFALAQPAFSEVATFGGNDCTEDCSGHVAGYRWAEENSVTSASDCNGNSQSFNEGCETYVDDPSRGADEDDQGNEITD